MYISGHDYSFQAMHIEDEAFSSVNILHYGNDVLWIVVPDSAKKDLVTALVKYWWGPIEKLSLAYLDLVKQYVNEELSHKRFFIQEQFLIESGIPYNKFHQKKGDMIVGKR